MAKLERDFQSKLIKDLKKIYPGCIIMKNDPDYIQGIPDLILLVDDMWFALECKKSERSPHRPNQDYYIRKMDDMSFARFIYPENKEEVLYDIQQSLRARR